MTKSYQPIQDYLNAKLPDYLQLLQRMVAVNSFTHNRVGVNEVGLITAEAFVELGFNSEIIPTFNIGCGDHLVMTRSPINYLADSTPTIALISHLDTVFPPDEEQRNDFIWRDLGEKIIGPGTFDIKGGTVSIYMVLDAIKRFHPELYEGVRWVVLVDAQEEIVAAEFAELCRSRLAAPTSNTLAALVFEGGGSTRHAAVTNKMFPTVDDYSLVTTRKGRALFKISVHGKASHAGVSHADGANAIVQLASTVLQLAEITDYEDQLTVNVGVISGGTVVNRVPHYAEVTVEMRAFDPSLLNRAVKKVLELAGPGQVRSADGVCCQIEVEVVNRSLAWPSNSQTENLFKIWSKAAEDIGIKIYSEARGGLSDANYLYDYVPTIDGLGPLGGAEHCSEEAEDGSRQQEYIEPDSFVVKALLNVVGIVQLLENRS